jgi:chemotaxis protein methyltransferase CheR
LKRQLLNVPPDYLKKYFATSDGGQNYKVSAEVLRRVTFKRANMIEDPFQAGYDLILCRNVVIYFTAETKTTLYQKFSDALAPGGFFLVGSTEQIFDHKQLGFESAGPFIYRKPLPYAVQSGAPQSLSRSSSKR